MIRRATSLHLIGALAIVSIAGACGSTPPRPREGGPSEPARVQWEGSLADLLPSDADVVVLARPDQLVREPASRRVISSFATDDRLEQYRQHTGIDPRTLTELVWASTPEGQLLIVRGPFHAPLAVAEMGARMLPLESSADAPFLRRAGHYQGARRDLIALSDHVLVAVSGTPALTQAVMDRVRGDDATPPLIARPELASVLAEHVGAPVVLIAPQPLGLPPGSGIALLLARERLLVATIAPSGPDELSLAADLRGEFPPGADGNFRQLVESLAETDLGGALGMRDVQRTLSAQAEDGRVLLRARVPAAAVAGGLRVLFDAEISELVGPEGPTGASERSEFSP